MFRISRRFYRAGSLVQNANKPDPSSFTTPGASTTKTTVTKSNPVPESPAARLVQIGSLAFSVGFRTIAELTRQTLTGQEASIKSAAMTEQNVENIANALCQMRGAALKLGQMLSIQDETLLPPELQAALSKVRRSANSMPPNQLHDVMTTELGENWRSKFEYFDETPIAAASIGQVHRAVLKPSADRSWTNAAIKIQYPGITRSIDSDLKMVSSLMANAGMLPKGMYMNNTIKAAREELLQETDYLLEASLQQQYSESLKDMPEFIVPKIEKSLTTKRVLTMEFAEGIHLEDVVSLDQETRNQIGQKLLNLCMIELFTLNLMQTDPNWSNFLFQPNTGKIVLLDFGASRQYKASFIKEYLRIVYAAANNDKQTIIDGSIKLGFLTGDETKSMIEAHAQAVLALGEPFRTEATFDWGQQQITKKIHGLIPKMLSERLTPPPQETYSIHRKLAGAYLLCSKLRSVFPPRKLLFDAYDKFQKSPSA